jgi:single-strand DNA-binding protein
MFGDVNRVTLLGNVTKDPDLRFTPSGAAVLSFSMATNRRFQKDGQWTDEPSFHNIVVWNQAEQLAQRIKKGTRIYIEGRLQTRSWDGQDGKKQYKTEVVAEKVILIARFEGDNADNGQSAAMPAPKGGKPDGKIEVSDAAEDMIDPSDLPF